MAQDANQVDTAELRSRIEQTRTELGHTIDAIQDRLSPRRVMHDAKETITDATVGRARRIANRVTEVVNSDNTSHHVNAVLNKARNSPAMTAVIGTAVGAVLLALVARSRPTLARSLGGFALSLVMAAIAQQRTSRQSSQDAYPAAF
jgi:hypothetical protein